MFYEDADFRDIVEDDNFEVYTETERCEGCDASLSEDEDTLCHDCVGWGMVA